MKIDEVARMFTNDIDRMAWNLTAQMRMGAYQSLFPFVFPVDSCSSSGFKMGELSVSRMEICAFFRAWEKWRGTDLVLDDVFSEMLAVDSLDYDWVPLIPYEFLIQEEVVGTGQAKIAVSFFRLFCGDVPRNVTIVVVGSSSINMGGLTYDRAVEILSNAGFSGRMYMYDQWETPGMKSVGNFVVHRIAQFFNYNKPDPQIGKFTHLIDDAFDPVLREIPFFRDNRPWHGVRFTHKSFDDCDEDQPYYRGNEKRHLSSNVDKRNRGVFVDGMDRCRDCILVSKILAGLPGCVSDQIFALFVKLGVTPCTRYVGAEMLKIVGEIDASVKTTGDYDHATRSENYPVRQSRALATMVASGHLKEYNGRFSSTVVVSRAPVLIRHNAVRVNYKGQVRAKHRRQQRAERQAWEEVKLVTKGRPCAVQGYDRAEFLGPFQNQVHITKAEVVFVADPDVLQYTSASDVYCPERIDFPQYELQDKVMKYFGYVFNHYKRVVRRRARSLGDLKLRTWEEVSRFCSTPDAINLVLADVDEGALVTYALSDHERDELQDRMFQMMVVGW